MQTKDSKNPKRVAPIVWGVLILFASSTLFAQSVALMPGSPSVAVGGRVQFSAQSSGLASGVTVQWYAGGVLGGNASYGTISAAGLYVAPAAVPAGNEVRILAYASDGSASSKTFVTILPAGSAGSPGSPGNSSSSANVPVITAVTPNPLPVGTDTITISGSGFKTGVLVYDSYGAQSMIQYAPTSSNAGTITVTIYQGAASTSTFCVKNPGTACSNSLSVTVGGSSSGSGGNGAVAAPVLTTVTPTPIPVGTQTITIAGSGFVAGALIYQQLWQPEHDSVCFAAQSPPGPSPRRSIRGSAATTYLLREEPGLGLQQLRYRSRKQRSAAAPDHRAGFDFREPRGNSAIHFSGSNGLHRYGGLHHFRRSLHGPAAMPSSANVTVTATGPGGNASATVTLINPNPQIITPAAITLTLGATQQFTSAGGSNWTAINGTIRSDRLLQSAVGLAGVRRRYRFGHRSQRQSHGRHHDHSAHPGDHVAWEPVTSYPSESSARPSRARDLPPNRPSTLGSESGNGRLCRRRAQHQRLLRPVGACQPDRHQRHGGIAAIQRSGGRAERAGFRLRRAAIPSAGRFRTHARRCRARADDWISGLAHRAVRHAAGIELQRGYREPGRNVRSIHG